MSVAAPGPSRARAATCLAAVALGLGCAAEPASERPDVVLVTLDTTRADHLGLLGYPRDVSPVLDAFAREAVVYPRAWSTAPWTLPAHASLLTGKHPTSHGAHFSVGGGDTSLAEALEGDYFGRFRVDRLGEEQVTLAELLREQGYATAVFAGGPWLAPAFGLLQGYEHRDADVRELQGRRADGLTDAAVDWIRGVPRSRPLHLLLNYFDPHEPYAPPPGFAPPLAGEPAPAAPELRAEVDGYDREIRFMDHHLGRLLEALRATGRYPRALVIVVGDHGELFGEHGLRRHGRWHYEELLRVPLLIRFPGGRRGGTRVESPVSLVDLLPLVAAELAFPLPAGVEGVLVGQRRLVLAETFRDDVSIGKDPRFDRDLVTGIRWPWKLILGSDGERELYRLDTDPREQRNRAQRPEAEELAREIEAARAALAAPRPVTPRDVPPETVESLRELGYLD